MRRTGKSQSGGNFGRGILGSIPNVEPEFGIQQSSLLGASLQTSGYDSFAGTRGLLGSMQMGNIGASDFNQTSGGLGSGASINMQQELLARQQALLLNNALAQQQQGLLSSQQGLIGSRPAGLDNGVTRLFGVIIYIILFILYHFLPFLHEFESYVLYLLKFKCINLKKNYNLTNSSINIYCFLDMVYLIQ